MSEVLFITFVFLCVVLMIETIQSVILLGIHYKETLFLHHPCIPYRSILYCAVTCCKTYVALHCNILYNTLLECKTPYCTVPYCTAQ
jgi:hypothetical protein